MAKKLRTELEIDRDALALEPPRMTVLSDQPLLAEEAHRDSLTLAVKLGPIYDIVRHPDTRTPLAIAIYGDWGTGKTSAMRWLQGLLVEWNARGDRGKGGTRGKVVRPVWFYPWKYHDKDDVWRGLIAEVILASIRARGATLGRIKKAVKEFGLFLGRSFLHALSSIELPTGVNAFALQGVYEDYKRTVSPETNYLNEFESTLSEWVKETISDAGERMVIFIDDLDRCLPEVALQVLEALKLYLNINDLIFVVGVDRVVIDQLLQKLYTDIGLEPEKSRHYLAKMFQVEVVIGPNEQQAETFLDKQLTAIGEHTNQYWTTMLSDAERRMFRGVVLRLAQRNPREIKRLLNSVLIHGAGVMHVADRPFSFAQGMQIFLVRKILEERYTMGLTVDTKAGMEFFHGWSKLVRSGAPATVAHPEDMALKLGARRDDNEDVVVEGPAPATRPAGEDDQSPYAALLTEPRFAHLRRLLADTDLGQLMQIEYPSDTTMLAEGSRKELPFGLIREAIARQRGKAPSALTAWDYDEITQLVLEGEEIMDIAPVQVLSNLHSLDLSFTAVEDLAPLKSLSNLDTLVLTSTRVGDLAPLRDLEGLHSLSLANTPITDVHALSRLRHLRVLDLRGVPIKDTGPLASLTALESLSLAQTKVESIEPLTALTALESLSLAGTRVSNIDALAGLSALGYLDLSNTEVSDLGPLAGLERLDFIDLRGCTANAQAVAGLRDALPGATIRT